MSELIQESKYITVQEFLPQWSDLVERFINPTYSQQLEKGLDIWNPKYCLVSEAWDFNRKFGTEKCIKCSNYATGLEKINGIWYHQAIENLRDFYTFKQGLYEHFMESHQEILLKK